MRFKIIYVFFQLINIFAFAQDNNEIDGLIKEFEDVVYIDFNKAQALAIHAVEECENVQNVNLQLQSFMNLSQIYFLRKKNDSSYKYSKISLKYALEQNDYEKQAKLLVQIGSVEKRKGNYNNAISEYEKANRIAVEYNFSEQLCDIHNNLALLYRIRGDKKKTSEELYKAIKIAKKINSKNTLAASYNIKGVLFFDTKKDSSIFYYNQALNISEETNNKYYQGLVLSNLGDVYLSQGNYDEAFEHINSSEKIAKSVGNNTSLHYINLSLGIYYEELSNYKEAIHKYKKAISDYEIYVDEYQKLRAYWLLSGAYYHNKEFKKAFEYQEEYIDLNESLLNAKKTKEFDEIRTQYEVENKDIQITLLKTKNELKSTRINNLIILAISILIPLVLLLIFYGHRIKTQRTIRKQEQKLHEKEKLALEQKQKLVEVQALIDGQDKERNRIAKELHDGVGGQLAGINLRLDQINSEIKNNEIKIVNKSISKAFKEIRILSHSLSSNYFKDKDFELLLIELKEQYEASNSFKLNIIVFPKGCLTKLDKHVKHNLYRILQELLNNVLKHAKANSIDLSINMHQDLLMLIFEDNGIGFDVGKVQKGIGMSNIHERVKLMDGNITIDSQIENGTQIVIEIPN